jgi:hypothetical protein
MKIQDRLWKSCKSCGQNIKLLKDETYGCDECGKPINFPNIERNFLEMAVFSHTEETKHFQFCSWKCCLKKGKKLKPDYFISLPYLSFDEKQKGLRAEDFWRLVK